MSATGSPHRPQLGLRIGVTGDSRLKPDALPRISAQVGEILRVAKFKMDELAAEPKIQSSYSLNQDRACVPILRFLSPLAHEAHRLAAREALALGYSLHVPMPFDPQTFEQNFNNPEELKAYRELFAKAGEAWLAIDGDHDTASDGAYAAVERLVARHADVMIAIWDGKPSERHGDTADFVRFAASRVPVVWVHALEARPPQWIAEPLDLNHPPDTPAPYAESLKSHLKEQISPPDAQSRSGHGLMATVAQFLQPRHQSLEQEYFNETDKPRCWLWRAYAVLISWTAHAPLPWTPPTPPEDPVARHWFDRYAPPDTFAINYAARYRSAYVWVFLLGTLALAAGATELVFSLLHPEIHWLELAIHVGKVVTTFAELVFLCLIVVLVVVAIRRDWHERSVEYRLIAELFRKQQVLAPLGWSLPISAVRSACHGEVAGHNHNDTGTNRAGWVAWLFAAEQRVAPFPRGDLRHAASSTLRKTVLDLIDEQLTYHAGRMRMAEQAGSKLALIGELLFGAVLFCVFLKLFLADWMHLDAWAVLCAWAATVLPAVSAAFVGIRAYTELPLLANQSLHMIAELERAKKRVLRLNMDKPLVSQDLGSEASMVVTLMLQELEGWVQTFRIKAIEVG